MADKPNSINVEIAVQAFELIGQWLDARGVPEANKLFQTGESDPALKMGIIARLDYLADVMLAQGNITVTQTMPPPMTFRADARQGMNNKWAFEPSVQNAPSVEIALASLRRMIVEGKQMIEEATMVKVNAPPPGGLSEAEKTF